MRIRTPFAAAFFVLLFLSAFGGLLPHSSLPPTPSAPFPHSDKLLHLVTFFALTLTFYFILDTTRRRAVHVTLSVCTLAIGVGSEVVQGLLPNGREFDALDVLANLIGSLAALGLAQWYHRRSAERRRNAKYSVLTGEGLEGEEGLELGLGPGLGRDPEHLAGQETGVILPTRTVQEELDNWDENAEDEAWDEDENGIPQDPKMTPASSSVGDEEQPKKVAVD